MYYERLVNITKTSKYAIAGPKSRGRGTRCDRFGCCCCCARGRENSNTGPATSESPSVSGSTLGAAKTHRRCPRIASAKVQPETVQVEEDPVSVLSTYQTPRKEYNHEQNVPGLDSDLERWRRTEQHLRVRRASRRRL